MSDRASDLVFLDKNFEKFSNMYWRIRIAGVRRLLHIHHVYSICIYRAALVKHDFRTLYFHKVPNNIKKYSLYWRNF
jgi:uncharacterized membrane protein